MVLLSIAASLSAPVATKTLPNNVPAPRSERETASTGFESTKVAELVPDTLLAWGVAWLPLQLLTAAEHHQPTL